MSCGRSSLAEHLGQRHDAVLGDAVRAEADVRNEPGERRGEQHVPALALLDHPRQERLDAVDRTPQVDVDDPSPVVVRHVDDRPANGHAGVVEHDVHRPEGVERSIGHRRHFVQRAHVAHDPVGLHASAAQRIDGGVECRPLDVGEHQTRAPCAPRTRAVASPIPLAPPVTTAPLPVSVSIRPPESISL